MNGCDLPNPQHLGNHEIDFQFTNRVLAKQLINSEAAIKAVVPNSFRQRLQLRFCIGRPFKTWGQPLQERVGVRRCFLEIVKLVAMPHRGNQHIVWRLSDLDRLQAIGNWLHSGGEGKTPGNIVAQEELPECFLSGELLKLTATKRATLKIERGYPFVVFVQHLKLASWSGADDGLVDRNQIDVRQTSAQFLRSAWSLARTNLIELDHLNDAPINTVDFLRELAGGIDQFAFLQMPHVRQFAEGLQLNRPECRAKGEEIATGHVPDYSKSHAGRASNLYISGFRAS